MKDDKYLTEGYWFKLPEDSISRCTPVIFDRNSMGNDNPTFAVLSSKNRKAFMKAAKRINVQRAYYLCERGLIVPMSHLEKQVSGIVATDPITNAYNHLFEMVPIHHPPMGEAGAEEVVRWGETYYPIMTMVHGMGVCDPKASLLSAMLRIGGVEARVVGIDKFPDGQWERIKNQFGNVSSLFLDFIQDDGCFVDNFFIHSTYYFNALEAKFPGMTIRCKQDVFKIADKIKEDGILKLTNKNPFNRHYWVEAYNGAEWINLDTSLPHLQRDPIYQEAFKFMLSNKYVCAELKKDFFQGDELIQVKETRK
ncbi:MAG TPA: transglutaminase domain-containing protein [Candidatus Nanoarchaeia archaeon]|nr:transglutaminase domain-containing protein [Candidatus Nanoarchaeia archaeon]